MRGARGRLSRGCTPGYVRAPHWGWSADPEVGRYTRCAGPSSAAADRTLRMFSAPWRLGGCLNPPTPANLCALRALRPFVVNTPPWRRPCTDPPPPARSSLFAIHRSPPALRVLGVLGVSAVHQTSQ